jgi:hypothetical protein
MTTFQDRHARGLKLKMSKELLELMNLLVESVRDLSGRVSYLESMEGPPGDDGGPCRKLLEQMDVLSASINRLLVGGSH